MVIDSKVTLARYDELEHEEWVPVGPLSFSGSLGSTTAVSLALRVDAANRAVVAFGGKTSQARGRVAAVDMPAFVAADRRKTCAQSRAYASSSSLGARSMLSLQVNTSSDTPMLASAAGTNGTLLSLVDSQWVTDPGSFGTVSAGSSSGSYVASSVSLALGGAKVANTSSSGAARLQRAWVAFTDAASPAWTSGTCKSAKSPGALGSKWSLEGKAGDLSTGVFGSPSLQLGTDAVGTEQPVAGFTEGSMSTYKARPHQTASWSLRRPLLPPSIHA